MDLRLVQRGILDGIPTQGAYLFFSAVPGGKLREVLNDLAKRTDGDALVVGIGASLVNMLGARITGLRPFPVLDTSVDIPATPFGLWCWLRGDDRGELLLRRLALASLLAEGFALELAVDGFKYDSGRDLTGYEDGTENPKGDDAIASAFVGKGKSGLKGSSFAAVQLWQHDLDRFSSWSRKRQDNAVGRRRSDNEELDDAPESAHVKRTAQESFEPKAFVLRRSMPWSDREGNAGLLFVAFGKNLDRYEVQMRRMAGLDDGIVDAMFDFSRPLTGSYFWCPPMKGKMLDLSAL